MPQVVRRAAKPAARSIAGEHNVKLDGMAAFVNPERMKATTRPKPVREFPVDKARVEIFEDRLQAGQAAAFDVSRDIVHHQPESEPARIVFAAAPSQNEFLASLVGKSAIDWSRVSAFHMDEYLGLKRENPASFRYYLQQHLFDQVAIPPEHLHLIPGEKVDRPLRVCSAYEELLRSKPIDIVCGGIGENGHLAFNDPAAADFLDPLWVKIVRLDEACRTQQVHDGCFGKFDDVPTHAFTLTLTALMSASVVSVVVPGRRKARAVQKALIGPISAACPASILRGHPGVRIYLDPDSARMLV
jgi:glucosamine-6-phosphate deaminase